MNSKDEYEIYMKSHFIVLFSYMVKMFKAMYMHTI